MYNTISHRNIPDDVLYKIFKQFVGDNKIHCISNVNKEWGKLVMNRLMFQHLRIVIINKTTENRELEVDNYLLQNENKTINSLYDDLIDTVETVLTLNNY